MAAALMGTDHYVYRQDGRVYLHKIGGGEPLLFLHLVGASGWSWRKVVDQFAMHFECYVLDLPGFDHSDIPPRQYSMDDYATAVLDVMDAAGLEQTDIIGARTGAILGMILAAEHPERVKRLVLNGLPYWDKEHGQIIWEKFFLPQFTDTTSYHLPVNPLTTWEEDREKNPALDREAWQKAHDILEKSRLWSRLSEQGNTGYDIQAIGPKVTQPTLLLFGENDVLRRSEQRAHSDIKGSILKTIAGSGGLTFDDRPEEFVGEVLDFLESKQ
ncbi:MAG: alpha/beta hydrolase [Chloroflexi bacterium]|nr:alpha/beta hydrolase [Chloroflexota bacterium]